MKLQDVKIGMEVKELISGQVVRVSRIGATKHYGPERCVRVYFPMERHYEYYAPGELEEVVNGEKGSSKTAGKGTP